MADQFTEADGYQLVADLLRELAALWAEDLPEIPDEEMGDFWKRRDPNVLRRYVATVRDSKSAALERGFYCALSDFIASSADGGSPGYPELYERA